MINICELSSPNIKTFNQLMHATLRTSIKINKKLNIIGYLYKMKNNRKISNNIYQHLLL